MERMHSIPEPSARVDVMGCRISACDMTGAIRLLESSPAAGGYVCFMNVHAVVTAAEDPELKAMANGSLLSVADGKPVQWAARLSGDLETGHIPGPDFMIEALRRFPRHGHFFYGSRPEVLAALVARLKERIPALKVAGALAPPFRPLTPEERAAVIRRIRESNAAFVWVGLGAPKQERWMAEMWAPLRPALLFGVGAAFDFHAGFLRRAPRWMRRLGLEWLYRLRREPRRLWKRYLITNSLFLYYLLKQPFRSNADRAQSH